jgi:hypothetical protein
MFRLFLIEEVLFFFKVLLFRPLGGEVFLLTIEGLPPGETLFLDLSIIGEASPPIVE